MRLQGAVGDVGDVADTGCPGGEAGCAGGEVGSPADKPGDAGGVGEVTSALRNERLRSGLLVLECFSL
jgi:hypothetical protein